MRDLSQAPPDFVSYVERRLAALDSAAHRLTGDDNQADRLARELLTLVALRWRRLRRADSRHELADGETADLYLAKLFQQEAGEFGYPHMALNLKVTVPARRRSPLAGALRAVDEAELIWEAARRVLRRRLLLAGLAGGVLALAALCRRGTGQNAGDETESTTVPRSTVLPTGAERAPAEVSGTREVRGVPKQISLPRDEPMKLSIDPIGLDPIARAVALVAASRADASQIYVLGSDSRWRRVDGLPELTALWLHSGALSPDGTRAVFGTSTGTHVVDLTSGTVQLFHTQPEAMRPVWLGPRHLLLAQDMLLDPVTGARYAIPEGPENALTPRHPLDPLGNPAERLIELLSVGEPATAPARLRRWRTEDSRLISASIPLNGPLTELIGAWRGSGFGIEGDNGLLVRACVPNAVPSVAGATAVVAVIRPRTGKVERALLVDSAMSGNVRVIGWADERRVLLALVRPNRQQIVTWDLYGGGLATVSEVNSDGVISLPDLSRVG